MPLLQPSHDRTKKLVRGVASSLVSRGVAALAPLLVVPVAIATYGSETYGLWATLLAFTGMVLFADFGLGNGLMTRLSETAAHDNLRESRRLIVSAYTLLALIAFGLVIALVVCVYLIDVSSVIGVPSGSNPEEVQALFLLFVLAFLVNLPLALIRRIQYALQQIGYSNAWSAFASLAAAGCFVALAHGGAGYVVAIGLSALVLPLANLVNALTYFTWRRPEFRPWGESASVSSMKSLARLGILFFVLSVLMAASMNIDALLITNTLGLSETALFSATLRIAGVLSLFVLLVNLPLWPLNAEALARGDTQWVARMTIRMSLASGGAVALGGVIFLMFGRSFWDVWISSAYVDYSQTLVAGFVLWNIILALISPVFMVQNSVGVVWPQLIGFGSYLVVSIPTKIWVLGMFGVQWLPYASSAVYGLLVVPFAILGYQVTLRARRAPQDSEPRSRSATVS